MRKKPDTLYHYCCSHSAADIRSAGVLECAETLILRANPDSTHTKHPQGYIVWLTDMEPPAHREALGLTMHDIKCDRIKYCFEVAADWKRMEWYMTFRRRHPELRDLENEPGVLPAHWWVARGPIPVLREVVP